MHLLYANICGIRSLDLAECQGTFKPQSFSHKTSWEGLVGGRGKIIMIMSCASMWEYYLEVLSTQQTWSGISPTTVPDNNRQSGLSPMTVPEMSTG